MLNAFYPVFAPVVTPPPQCYELRNVESQAAGFIKIEQGLSRGNILNCLLILFMSVACGMVL